MAQYFQFVHHLADITVDITYRAKVIQAEFVVRIDLFGASRFF